MEPMMLSSSSAPRASARSPRTIAREAVVLVLCMLVPPVLASFAELPLDLFSVPFALALVCESFRDLATFVARSRGAAYQRLRASLGLACVVLSVNELWNRFVDPVLAVFDVSQGVVHAYWIPVAEPMPGYDGLPMFVMPCVAVLVTGWIIDVINWWDRRARGAKSSTLPAKLPAAVLMRGVRFEERPTSPSQEASP